MFPGESSPAISAFRIVDGPCFQRPNWQDSIYGNKWLPHTKASWHLPLRPEGRLSWWERPPLHCRPPLTVSTSQKSLAPFPGLSVKTSPPLSDRSFGSRSSFLIRRALGRAPERPPVSMPSVHPRCEPSSTSKAAGDCKHASCSWAKGCVYSPSWTTTWPVAKTKILQCVFFPRNDNYSTPNIFRTSTTKMEKASQKIIY